MMNVIKSAVRKTLSAEALEAIRGYRHGTNPVIAPLVRRYCSGQGLEVGAGKTPYCDPDRTTFLDKNVGDKDSTENADIIADANAIPRPDASFDYVFSSHVLEHVPNTIRTLKEWMRVLKPGGVIFAVLPHAEKTIDRFREVTTLDHHIADFEQDIDHTDRSHFDEMKAGWQKLPGDRAAHEQQYRDEWGAEPWDWDFRIKHSVLHYHVWSQAEIVRLFEHVGLKVIYANEHVPEREDSFVVIGRKQV